MATDSSPNGAAKDDDTDCSVHEHHLSSARDYPAKGGVLTRAADSTPVQTWVQESMRGEERAWMLTRMDEHVGYPHLKTGPSWDLVHLTPCSFNDPSHAEGFVMTALSGCKVRPGMPEITLDEVGEVTGRDAARVLLAPFSYLRIKDSGTKWGPERWRTNSRAEVLAFFTDVPDLLLGILSVE